MLKFEGLLKNLVYFFALLFFLGGSESWALKRNFALFTEYTHVVVSEKKEWEFDVRIQNRGKRDEEILLSIVAPEGWKAGLFRKWEGYEVKAIKLGTEEGYDSVDLSLKLSPPKEIKEGEDYVFVIKGCTKDKRICRSLDFTLTFKKQAISFLKSKTIELISEYPSLKEPAGKNFEFLIEVKNKSKKARVFDLSANIPYGWGAYCTPRWEEEKRISALKVDAKGSEWVRFVLVPPPFVAKGDYQATFEVGSENEKASINLKAVVIGTYKLRLASEAEVLGTGEARNIRAVAGQKKHYTLYLYNEGTASISDINFYSQKPKDWEVSFEPKKVPMLEPLNPQVPKFEKVDVTIKPKAKAIPGDYLVTITAVAKEAKDTLNLRVTVGKPVIWGWIGIAIVIATVVALFGIFIKLGRR